LQEKRKVQRFLGVVRNPDNGSMTAESKAFVANCLD
jgi:hypothetical protein